MTGDYDVVSDSTTEDGTRTIVLKARDLSKFRKDVERLANSIGEKLGEKGLFIKLLKDALADYTEESVTKMLRAIESGKPVKPREGCYKIIIGDGRKRSHHEIQLLG